MGGAVQSGFKISRLKLKDVKTAWLSCRIEKRRKKKRQLESVRRRILAAIQDRGTGSGKIEQANKRSEMRGEQTRRIGSRERRDGGEEEDRGQWRL